MHIWGSALAVARYRDDGEIHFVETRDFVVFPKEFPFFYLEDVSPDSITAIRPLKDGVISDFEITEAMLNYFITKVLI